MPTDPTAKALAEIKKSIDSLQNTVSSLPKEKERLNLKNRGVGAAPSIDSLNDEEIEELRMLSAHRNDVTSFTQQRLSDPYMAGMYRGFHDLGLINCAESMSDQMVCFWVSPKALWVVQRHDNSKKEKALSERRETIRFAVSIVVPSLVSIAAVILTWWLTTRP